MLRSGHGPLKETIMNQIPALQHIKVLDISRLIPGPFATMLLADFGAEVIRIDQPGGGRRQAEEVFMSKEISEESFSVFNRNKKRIGLNLKSPEALEIFDELVKTADVLVEGYRPGVTKRLKVDYPRLREINSKLIYCSISGYGQDGPYKEKAGHALCYLGYSGLGSLFGGREKDKRSYFPTFLTSDIAGAGMTAVISILTALVSREKTGMGQHIDLSITESLLGLMHFEYSRYQTTSEPIRPGEARCTLGDPDANIYETKDTRFIAVNNSEPWMFKNFCEILGRPDLSGFQFDSSKKQLLFEYFNGAFKTKTLKEWLKLFGNNEICVAPINNIDEIHENPQFKHREMFVEIENLHGKKVRQIGLPFKLSATPGQVRHGPLKEGANTDEILSKLNIDASKIKSLKASGSVT